MCEFQDTFQNRADEPVLATWFFIHPSFVDIFQLGLSNSTSSNSSSSASPPAPPPKKKVKKGQTPWTEYQELECLSPVSKEFQTTFHKLRQEHGEDVFLILHQRHGELVEVAPGWAHAVANRYPNVKIAWDLCKFRNLRFYVDSWMKESHRKLKISGDYALLEQHLVELGHDAYTKVRTDMV
jgi:hypothetical protein